MIQIHGLRNFDLGRSVAPGQAFRWEFRDGWYRGVVGDRLFRARLEGETLSLESTREDDLAEFARDYFDLDRDYDEILAHINTDLPMARAIEAARGLRVLRQEPWECFVSYIMSIHNNVPRIQRMVSAVAQHYGRPLELGDFRAYSFPTPDELARSCELDLRNLRFGFRSRSVCDAATRVAEEGIHLADLRKLDYQQARHFLMQFRGIGEKVADCISLFSLDKTEAFPVDVWIKRAVEQLYFGGRELPIRDVHAFAAERWGKWAGYAQTFLFYYVHDAKGLSAGN